MNHEHYSDPTADLAVYRVWVKEKRKKEKKNCKRMQSERKKTNMEVRDAPITIKSVRRLDSIILDDKDNTYFTSEGYLVDHPILTSVGIFEYHNEDGSIRRELRLPEHVFNEKSLSSYKGKPIIITHDAGEVTKDNVAEETIGTILSEGYQDGQNVKAEIIIHDTDAMKKSGLKELSLGYSLDLIEEPGTWKGSHYDAIQTNIIINHLALVSAARAGDKARLNIDSSDGKTLKGGKAMKTMHRDAAGDLSPEELEKAIALYKATQPLFGGTPTDGDSNKEEKIVDTPKEEKTVVAPKDDNPVVRTEEVEKEDADEEVEVEEEKKVAQPPKQAPTQTPSESEATPSKPPVKPNTPQKEKGVTTEGAPGVNKDLNAQVIAVLEKTIADLKAQMGTAENTDEDEEITDTETEEEFVEDEDEVEDTETESEFVEDEVEDTETESEFVEDEDEFVEEETETEETEFDEDDLSNSKANSCGLNTDSADDVRLYRAADRLNISIEDKSNMNLKKEIIKKVCPQIRLDGKSKTYINAAFDLAYGEVDKYKGADYQRSQMFNGRYDSTDNGITMAESARQRMIERER